MLRAIGIEVVGHRPDAEIRIVRHQRNGRRTHLRSGAKQA